MGMHIDRSDPSEEALTSWIMAGLAAAGASWVGWMLGWPWIFDINHPDFNPMLIIVGLLIGVAVWHLFKAISWQARAKRFGATEIEIDGPVPVPMGRELSGRLRFSRPVAPLGDWILELTCLDIHAFRDSNAGTSRHHAYPVWNERIAVSAGISVASGLPFRFTLPASVGQKPVRSIERKNQFFRFKFSINVPGLRRIMTHNAPPVDRVWKLVVSAPADGSEFRAEFAIPIEH